MREHIIHNNTPAEKWVDSYPVGNGRLGAAILGFVDEDVLYLNEETVWSSNGNNAPNPDMADKLKEIRELFINGREAEGDKLAKKSLTDCFTRISSYETAGILKVNLHNSNKCANYTNDLDLMRGVAKVEYNKDLSHYKRECFASYPDNVLVYRVESSENPLSACISFERENMICVNAEENELCAVAKTIFGDHKFAVKVRAITDGTVFGKCGSLVIKDAKAFTLLINIDTEFRHGEDFAKVSSFPEITDYEELKKRHVDDFLSHMSRAELLLPETKELEPLSMSERLRINEFNKVPDNGIVMLQWQFSRYVILSTSRKGTLPANLQGLWTKSLASEWSADYHTNINLQENYWSVEVTNLADCHVPLFDYMNEYLLESGRETAKIGYKARGTVTHHLSDIYKFTIPADGLWGIWPHGASWLTYHMWEHYLYTQDKDFLKNDAYEFMRDSAIFFVDTMVENKDGYLVYGPSTSPENRYWITDENGEKYACYLTLSSTMDISIIGGLFRNFLDASGVLGIEDNYVKEVREAQKKLPPLKISSSGRIQEWMNDYEETQKGHFHLSHTFAHYPDCAINRTTPELQKAVEQTIYTRLTGPKDTRGYCATNVGWSLTWLINHLSRLRKGDNAYTRVLNYLAITNPRNLWDVHAKTLQIDGNCSFAGAVCEMLLQSHEGVIALLPALPKEWNKGAFNGLRVRGGAEISIKWEDSEVKEIIFTPDNENEFVLEFTESQKTKSFVDADGTIYTINDNKITLCGKKEFKLIAK